MSVCCRLVSLVCSHRVDFSKAAPYVVADYCTAVQQVTIYPTVKVLVFFSHDFYMHIQLLFNQSVIPQLLRISRYEQLTFSVCNNENVAVYTVLEFW